MMISFEEFVQLQKKIEGSSGNWSVAIWLLIINLWGKCLTLVNYVWCVNFLLLFQPRAFYYENCLAFNFNSPRFTSISLYIIFNPQVLGMWAYTVRIEVLFNIGCGMSTKNKCFNNKNAKKCHLSISNIIIIIFRIRTYFYLNFFLFSFITLEYHNLISYLNVNMTAPQPHKNKSERCALLSGEWFIFK